VGRFTALALACLTGCYTTTGRTRIARDFPEHVESRPNGTHLDLAVVEAEPGQVVVAAEARDMCREQERGQRTYDVEIHQTKSRMSGGSGGHPAILILAPLLILGAIIHLASPEHTVTVMPTEEPPVPYTAWRGARAPCGVPPRPAPGVPLVLALRLSANRCASWTATTGPDGRLPLAEALEPAAAVAARCDRLAEDGWLLVEAAPEAERTSDQPRLPLPPAQSAALAASVPEAPPSARAAREQAMAEALRACAPRLSLGCLDELTACDREAEEKGDVSAAHRLCAYATRRCEPRAADFEWCAAAAGR
jgi:hypothetical protein